ncbi:YncE family protein [Nostoc sp.]|uniref:YncE family protein n=1 Tax=Nostoc sp. TaxID=1180 RepID=UPI002FF9B2D0
MHSLNRHPHEPCLDCELPTQERLNYFTGQFLTERDLRADQAYHIGKHRQHNRYLHGHGSVCGLKVTQHPNPACRDRFIVLEAGLALDCCGREIVVHQPVYFDLVAALAPQKADPTITGKHLLLSLCYSECKTEFVPTLYAECGCTDTGSEANRIYEGFEMEAKLVDDDKLPKPQVVDPSGVRLEWTTTLTTDKAFRVAIDSQQTRIYVLNAADPNQIMVYDTEHYCLLKSIPFITIDGRIIDLAVSCDGHFLYILRYVETAPASGTTPGSGNYFLRILQVKDSTTNDDLNSVRQIESVDASKDIPLSPGSQTTSPQLAVGSKDTSGKVVTLDVNAILPNKKIIIWTDRINTDGANPAGALGDAAYPKYYEGDTGSDPRAIAISPDGSWLFIAETNSIQASKIETLSGGSPVTHTIAISNSENPLLIAVSGDSLWLYVITNAKKVYIFRIQETPTLFPAVNSTGVDLGTDTPITLQLSPTGKWGYVLLQGASNATKGWVKVINRDKLDDPGQAVSEAIAVTATPRDLVLAPDGQRLYAAGEGADKACGGVSVLNVSEDQCQDLFWRSLEHCPECVETCIPLAVVKDYATDAVVTDARINNRIRPLVPSTETLQQLILCALSSTGKPAPPIAGGDKGDQGDRGTDGAGLEPDITQIVALSWTHRKEGAFILIKEQPAIVIGFSRPVNVGDIDAEHIFQILIPHNDAVANELGLVCRCPVQGKIVPVEPPEQETQWNQPLITQARAVNGPLARGAAFLPANPDLLIKFLDLWVCLRGDFVVDEKKRAVDAEFVRGELPTGNRPAGSKVGIQGGLFESWFTFRRS